MHRMTLMTLIPSASLISSEDFPVRVNDSLFAPNNSLLPFLGNLNGSH